MLQLDTIGRPKPLTRGHWRVRHHFEVRPRCGGRDQSAQNQKLHLGGTSVLTARRPEGYLYSQMQAHSPRPL